ncbi:MAG: transporter [Flavobacteriales bacterium]|nr:transporter [Flavobacteriales bacterium]|tara:strand:- start:1656 stop:2069 length:414 start_codon:yes stop_codon:yes gene_type:complete
MRAFWYLIIGVFFGIVLFKSEAASWFRIYEMFNFASFHMYGIIGAAVVLGVIVTQSIKRFGLKSFYGAEIKIDTKEKSISRYLIGGIFFGLGWGLAGACPGPLFVLMGAGYFPIIIVFVSAIAGTFLYGKLKDHLPH